MTQKMGLVWDKKPEKVETQLIHNFPILIRDNGMDTISNKQDKDHILIEGENLHALMSLQASHKGMVDIIYIDPPYNTGNSDFIYNDDYVDKMDGFKKSKWLTFMENRLVLAHNLMSDSGVIFISIDDRMLYELKMVMDRIFGCDNFVANLIWKKKRKGSHLSNSISIIHEYVLCYKKAKDVSLSLPEDVSSDDQYYPLYNSPNPPGQLKFPGGWLKISLPDGQYVAGEYKKQKLHNDVIVVNGIIINDFIISGRYRYSQKSIDEFHKECREIIVSKDFNMRLLVDTERTKNMKSILTKETYDIGTNEDADNEIKELFGKKMFDYPKPTSLIGKLILSCGNSNAIVLDFFAGSGTTGHAVLDLNKENNTNIQCILITNNENNICQDITKVRVQKIIEKNKQGNFRYFKTNLVPKGNGIDASKFIIAEQSVGITQICANMFDIVEDNKEFAVLTKGGKFVALLKDEDCCDELRGYIETNKIVDCDIYIHTLLDGDCSEFFEELVCVNMTEKILGSFKNAGMKDLTFSQTGV